MILLPILALFAGYAGGGRLKNLAALRFRLVPLLWACVALQIVGYAALGSQPLAAEAVTVVSSLGLTVWLIANMRYHSSALRVALGLVFVGWILNFVAIVPNHGMPVSARARHAAGVTAHTQAYYKHVSESDDTFARPLGDVIGVRPLAAVISVGDILIFGGLAAVVWSGMRRTR